MPDRDCFIAIDLKSFYASAECAARGLNPLDTNLVVADESRTDKTICLAVSPSLKGLGLPGRCRLFEVKQCLERVNRGKSKNAGSSYLKSELAINPELRTDLIIAMPRMAYYIEISTKIYQIYLKYVSPDDIHVYSIDEVFIDAEPYLAALKMTAHEFAVKLIHEVLDATGITATAGIGTNMYLCKVAMDIVAKHVPADKDGVRIAELDEMTYRKTLWEHRPLTDFWRVGKGYMKKLEAHGLYTMGDVALCSVNSEDTLYKLFGVNAELLIDHAWGWESCRISDIKSYRPSASSISNGQVLGCAVNTGAARVIACEMCESLSLRLTADRLCTDKVTLVLCYEADDDYEGPLEMDYYGRCVPKPSHGSGRVSPATSSAKLLCDAMKSVFDRIVIPELKIKRLYVTFENTLPLSDAGAEQLDMFTDYSVRELSDKKSADIQNAVLGIQKKYGGTAVFKGMDLEDGATGLARKSQIGGHRA